MFVGSEGTLGVVTRAVLRLHEAPRGIETVLLAVPSWPQVMSLLRFFDAALPGALGAFEVLWGNHYELNTGEYSQIDPPLPHGSPYYVLMDVFMADLSGDRDRLEALLADRMEAGDISDGAMAYSEAERATFWQIREDFEPEQKRYDRIYGQTMGVDHQIIDPEVEVLPPARRLLQLSGRRYRPEHENEHKPFHIDSLGYRSNTLPGLRMLAGSIARLMPRISSISAALRVYSR